MPHAGKAWIRTEPENKLKDHALDPDHPEGGSKAELFERCLGIVQDEPDLLSELLRMVSLRRLPESLTW